VRISIAEEELRKITYWPILCNDNLLLCYSIHRIYFSNNGVTLLFLVEHGADLNLVADGEKCTHLLHAGKDGNLPFVKRFLELGADVNGPPGAQGSTVHYALLSGYELIVKFLLNTGVDVVDSIPGQSTLCKALRFGMKDLLPVLLKKGADINEADSRGTTALGIAFERDDHETVDFLLNNGAAFADAGPDLLHNAARKKSLDYIRKLLDYGVDPNCIYELETPLGVS
jgi:uncharacterized protein